MVSIPSYSTVKSLHGVPVTVGVGGIIFTAIGVLILLALLIIPLASFFFGGF